MELLLTIVDTLLDLHAKLATVVRYYDRMLEERLSSTYGQLSLGGYRTNAPHTSSNIYPSIPAEPPGVQYGAENYYGREAPLQGSIDHPPNISNYYTQSPSAHLQQARALPGSIPSYGGLSSRDQQRPYPNVQTPQRAPSFPGYPQSPIENPGATFYSEDQHQSYHQQQDPSIQSHASVMSLPHPHPSTGVNSKDQSATYYLNSQNHAAASPQQAPHASAPSFNVAVVSPAQQNQPQSPTPDAARFQPVQQNRTEQPAQQGYWPQPSPSQYHSQQGANLPVDTFAKPDLQPNLTYPTMNSYSQDLFPSAPQHQPQPKVVEESLIEL